MNSPIIPYNPMMSTASADIIAGLQTQFGSIDYTQWQSLRATFYSYITYPEAGSNQLNFFGFTAGQPNGTAVANSFDTNIPRAGSFGQQHFIIKSISTDVRIRNNTFNTFALANCDTTTLASDFLMGFVNGGVLNFYIAARPFAQVPQPFRYMPPVGAQPVYQAGGITTFTAAGGPPVAAVSYVSDAPMVWQTKNRENVYNCDPQILIEAEQQFSVTIDYPSGLVPIIGTAVTDDTTNPLQVGVILDGILLRPLQ